MKLIKEEKAVSVEIVPGPDGIWGVIEQIDNGPDVTMGMTTSSGTFDKMQERYLELVNFYIKNGWSELDPSMNNYASVVQSFTLSGGVQNAYTLFVDGDTHIVGNLSVSGDMTVDGVITCKDTILTG